MAILNLEPLPRDCYPGEILRFIASQGQIAGKLVGKITLLGRLARVEVPDDWLGRLLSSLDGAELRGRAVRVRLERNATTTTQQNRFTNFAKLLELEAIAEREQLRREAQSATLSEGRSLRNLRIVEEDAGLGGRWIFTLQRLQRQALPPNRLQPGVPVVVSELSDKRGVSFRAIVSDRRERSISIALEQEFGDWSDEQVWRIDLSPDEVSRQRQLAALVRVESAQKDRLAELRDIVDGSRIPKFRDLESKPSEQLNSSQNEAVRFALSTEDIAVIHGPPGTGKTTTVVEFICRAVALGGKVLACAPSNAAVDNLLEKLMQRGEVPVRLGHPARVQENLRGRSLDLLVQEHPDARQARKMVREAGALFRQAERWTRSKPQPGEKQALRSEAREILKEARRLEQLATERVINEASIICATLTGVDSETLGQRRFDWIVIDEACQATEPACWVPMLRGDRVLFAGDPCQLPPTVLSDAAEEQGLGISLMEHLLSKFGSQVSRLLDVQYRMNSAIMNFSNQEFYEGKLLADSSVEAHTLADLEGIMREEFSESPVTFIDTAGAGHEEELEEDTGSRYNLGEADWVSKTTDKLLSLGVNPEAIGIITPYSGQVRRLRDVLKLEGEIDSVDGFQGREKEVIIYSLVRSNPEGQIGFLSDIRRTNVALTRARRKLVIIGDSATLSANPFYQRLVGYLEEIGAYRSVWEDPV
jgi:ATP-dependent RNA/DNA helicase IGHMBP2